MKYNIQNAPYSIWKYQFEENLKKHYKQYKAMPKPPDDNETWDCLQYLELVIEEILGIEELDNLYERSRNKKHSRGNRR